MSRRIARETALQVLFQVDLTQVDPQLALRSTAAEFAVPESSQEFAGRLVSGTLVHLQEIDDILKDVAKEWHLDRMSNVDRNILRLAAYELYFCPDIPGSVSVNEAIELAKAFSSEEASKFVNGILGTLLRRSNFTKQAKPEAASDLSAEELTSDTLVKGE